MSLIRLIKQQLGLSVTPANNFVLDASADNGTMKLARGNAGATTQDILTIGDDGKVTAPQGFVGDGAGLTGLPAQVTKFVSSDQTFALAGLVTVAHGLGVVPTLTSLRLVCQTAEAGWSIGDVVDLYTITSSFASGGFAVYCDSTNINARASSVSVAVLDKTTGVYFNVTPANWKLRITALVI